MPTPQISTFNELKVFIDQYLADNVSGAIDPVDVRTSIVSLIEIQSLKNDLLAANLSPEQSAAWNALIKKLEQIQIGNNLGFITPATPAPPSTGIYRGQASESGTYFGGIVVTSEDLEGSFVFIEVTNGVSKKILTKFQTISSSSNIPDWTATNWMAGSMVIYKKEIYKAEANTVASMIPGTATEWIKKVGNERIEAVLKFFLEYEEGYQKIVFQPSKWLRRDGGSFSATANMTCYNIDVTNYDKLFYNGKPSVIHVSEENIYCAIMGVKNDGSLTMIRASNSITGVDTTYSFPVVNEEYDISDFASISVSLGDLGGSVNPNPDCYIINTATFTTPGAPVINAVKKYIDNKIIPVETQILKGNTLLNSINGSSANINETFTTNKVTLAGGATIALGKIEMPANSTATIKENTLNENSEMGVLYAELTPAQTWVGFRSYHPSNEYGHSVFVMYHTSGEHMGKLELNRVQWDKPTFSTASNTNYQVGDGLRIGLVRDGLTYKMFVQNITRSWKIEMSVPTTPLGAPLIAHNSANPQIRNIGGSIRVYSYKHVFLGLNIENVVLGDSITYGQSAPTEEERFASLINGNNLVMGGGADVTDSVLKRIPEVILIKPRRALIMIGGNDYLFAVPQATWQQNLRDIDSQLNGAGIEVVHCYPTPRAGAGQLINFINSEFVLRQKIDTNTPLCSGGNTDLLAGAFNAGDALHLNPAGMKRAAEIINKFLI